MFASAPNRAKQKAKGPERIADGYSEDLRRCVCLWTEFDFVRVTRFQRPTGYTFSQRARPFDRITKSSDRIIEVVLTVNRLSSQVLTELPSKPNYQGETVHETEYLLVLPH
jgi:hypothetical protein